MAEKSLPIRIYLKDANKARDDFKALGADGEKYLKQIDKALDQPNRGLIAFKRAAEETRASVAGFAEHAGRAAPVLQAFGTAGAAAAVGIGAVALALHKGLEAYAQEERAQLRFQSVLKATGNAAGVTADQIDALAERLERSTFLKKEDILQAAGALATFKAVSGDAFESTIKLAADMAEVFGGDVVTNARLLGKAMQDPVNGLDALKRAAGALPPDVQRMAESLEKAGKHAQAVDLIIGQLQARVGGAAQDAASGYAGAIAHLGDSFEDLFKSIGRLVVSSGLIEYLKDVEAVIDAITARINRLSGDSGAANQKLLADMYVSGNIPFPDDAKGVAAMRAAAAKEYPGFREDRPATVTAAKHVSGYYFDATGNLHEPSKYQKTDAELSKEAAAANQAAERRLALQRQITDLEKEHAAFAQGGEKEVEVQRKMNQFLADTKGLREDEVAALAAQYEQQVRIAQADQEAAERAKKAAEEYQHIFEHASDRIQDAFADSFEQIFDKGLHSFSDLGKQIRSIMLRTAAEVASALVFKPVISGIFGNVAGSLLPGVSGGVTGTGGAAAGGGSLFSLGGLSNIGSGLLNGFTAPVINPGVAFDIGSYFGLGSGSVGALHTALGNFTPLSGIASLGGNLLGNLLFGGGGYSGVGGTIGGLAGTAFGGPIGGFIGSLAGNAIGGLFGGGKPHPQASFSSLVNPDGSLAVQSVLSKHMDTTGVQTMADQLSTFLQGLASVSDVRFRNYGVHGISNPSFTGFQTNSGQIYGFNPDDPSSIAGSFRDLALYLAKGADVVDNQLVAALQNVQVQGRDAAGVLAAVTGQLTGIKNLKAFSDSLLTNTATTNLSPEELYRKAAAAFSDTAGQFTAGTATADAVQAAALAYLQTSQGYAGRASGTYAGDLDAVQSRLNSLVSVAPRFASGGDFSGGLFVTHPGEIVMTSSTPGKVINARDTERLVGGGGNDLAMYQLFTELKATMQRLIETQARIGAGLARVTAA